jgi:hypothetical protein
MLRPTIGIMPIERVTARIGERMKRIIIVARMTVVLLIKIETLVLSVSCTTEVSELSLDTKQNLPAQSTYPTLLFYFRRKSQYPW